MISAEVLPPTFPLDTLRGDWNRLYDERAREPSLSFGWSFAMIRNHLVRRQDWFTVLLRRSSRVVGIIPMVRTDRRLLGRTVTLLQPMQEKNNTHSDLLISDYDPALLDAWLSATFTNGGRWDLLQMSRLLENSPLCAALEQGLSRGHHAFELSDQQPSYFLPLPRGYAEYLQARSAKFRSYLKRAEKKLQASGECGLDRVRATDDIDAAYRELLDIETSSWKHANGTAISAVAHQTGFYRELIESAQSAGTLHLTFLRIDGRAVAHNLGVVVNDCYYYLKTSFREEHKALGVATVARAWLIRELIADAVPHFDFPAEPYEWERQWTDETRWHRSLTLYNRTANAGLLRVIKRLRDMIRPRAGGRIVRHRDARDLKGHDA